MIQTAPAKLNACLYVGPTREDGRHALVTVFQPLDLRDDLELRPAHEDRCVCPGVEGPNLALEAIAAFRAATGWAGPPVEVQIAKHIPVQAGMAGGSADAAATLRLLRAHTGLGDADALRAIAAGLGADVPAQVEPRRCLGTGAGDVVEPLAPVEPYSVVVLTDPVGLPTGVVFAEADRLGVVRDDLGEVERAVRAAPSLDGELVHNDLQAAALSLRPELADRLDRLRDHGAAHALVSGSGPTTVGLFADDATAQQAASALGGLAVRTLP